jgi:hypothetical protein
MTDKFDNLPEYSRIWIYQSDRPLSQNERMRILQDAEKFAIDWTAHGKNLTAGSEILYDRFLILSVNEKVNGASGCSIDASVRFIRYLEEKYGLDLLKRSKVAFCSGDNTVETCDLKDIKMKIERQEITPDTLIFNNLVSTKGELKEQWLIPARNSWMKKYFN